MNHKYPTRCFRMDDETLQRLKSAKKYFGIRSMQALMNKALDSLMDSTTIVIH